MGNDIDIKNFQISDGQIGGHDYVDLGLSSGIMWATCNIGALKPYELGDYFAWGEVTPKEDYSESLYKWGTMFNLTKYCTNPTSLKTYGKIDNKKMLEIEDDAAAVNWGNGWRMPTISEMTELKESCEWEKVENFMGKGVVGMVGRSMYNGNSIFFPFAGYRADIRLLEKDCCGEYYTSHIVSSYPYECWALYLRNYVGVEGGYSRYVGQSVRAVAILP
ncbi:MAG: hypothetical protein E7077_02935 [Bacteroidales bacterium]|jgi:hypothetical protein|nr:hypothetical protein [Bacteroidales bacterium]